MALLVAACLTGAYAPRPPDFEIQTLGIFGAGVLLGSRDGAMVGALTMLVYSLMNPYGPAHPLVTLAQLAGQIPAGVAGGLPEKIKNRRQACGRNHQDQHQPHHQPSVPGSDHAASGGVACRRPSHACGRMPWSSVIRSFQRPPRRSLGGVVNVGP